MKKAKCLKHMGNYYRLLQYNQGFFSFFFFKLVWSACVCACVCVSVCVCV